MLIRYIINSSLAFACERVEKPFPSLPTFHHLPSHLIFLVSKNCLFPFILSGSCLLIRVCAVDLSDYRSAMLRNRQARRNTTQKRNMCRETSPVTLEICVVMRALKFRRLLIRPNLKRYSKFPTGSIAAELLFFEGRKEIA